MGRYGAFVGCSNYPECRFTRPIAQAESGEGDSAEAGDRDLGIDPRKCPTPTVIVIVDGISIWPPERYEQGLSVITAGTPIPHREALSPRVKSLNYLDAVVAKQQAVELGVHDAVMLDHVGAVEELGRAWKPAAAARSPRRTSTSWSPPRAISG